MIRLLILNLRYRWLWWKILPIACFMLVSERAGLMMVAIAMNIFSFVSHAEKTNVYKTLPLHRRQVFQYGWIIRVIVVPLAVLLIFALSNLFWRVCFFSPQKPFAENIVFYFCKSIGDLEFGALFILPAVAGYICSWVKNRTEKQIIKIRYILLAFVLFQMTIANLSCMFFGSFLFILAKVFRNEDFSAIFMLSNALFWGVLATVAVFSLAVLALSYYWDWKHDWPPFENMPLWPNKRKTGAGKYTANPAEYFKQKSSGFFPWKHAAIPSLALGTLSIMVFVGLHSLLKNEDHDTRASFFLSAFIVNFFFLFLFPFYVMKWFAPLRVWKTLPISSSKNFGQMMSLVVTIFVAFSVPLWIVAFGIGDRYFLFTALALYVYFFGATIVALFASFHYIFVSMFISGVYWIPSIILLLTLQADIPGLFSCFLVICFVAEGVLFSALGISDLYWVFRDGDWCRSKTAQRFNAFVEKRFS